MTGAGQAAALATHAQRLARGPALGLALGLSLAAAQPSAQAQPAGQTAQAAQADTAPTLAELGQLAQQLASPDGGTRKAAFEALHGLGDDALPAIRARLEQYATRGLDLSGALTAMSEFRRVQGVDAPDGVVDLEKGVLRVLDRDRGRGSVSGAELVLLLRALEGQKSPRAAELIVGQLFALDSKLFRYEAARTRERLNVLLIPAFIRYQTHPKSWIRTLCHDTLIDMGVDKPGRAVQQDDVVLLAAILDAYGDTLTFDAMPVVVSYLTDERVEVRDAARRAVRRFGKNAIWQIRERYVNATGKEAEPSWGWERTLQELVRLHESPKKQAFDAALASALTALERGEIEAAQNTLDRALANNPHSDHPERAGELYGRIAAHYLEADDVVASLAQYRRALRLDPNGSEASAFRARILYLEAELRLGDGVVDLDAYRQAIALDPAFDRASEALDELSGQRAARARMLQQALGLVAAVLMSIAAFFMLKSARRPGPPPARGNSAGEPTKPSEHAA